MDKPIDLTGRVAVSKEWYERVMELFGDRCGCPHCGSMREPLWSEQEGSLPRRGCLDCDTWFTKVQLRSP